MGLLKQHQQGACYGFFIPKGPREGGKIDAISVVINYQTTGSDKLPVARVPYLSHASLHPSFIGQDVAYAA